MKKVTVVLLVLVLVLALSVGAFAFQNEPEGFRGIKWGGSPTEEMVLSYQLGPSFASYVRPDDKLSIGDAKLARISYHFYTLSGEYAQLFEVMITFNGIVNYSLLEVICEEKFGPPPVKDSSKLGWGSSEVLVLLAYVSEKNSGHLSFQNRPLFYEYLKAPSSFLKKSDESDW